jgi:hypothetical protein
MKPENERKIIRNSDGDVKDGQNYDEAMNSQGTILFESASSEIWARSRYRWHTYILDRMNESQTERLRSFSPSSLHHRNETCHRKLSLIIK